MFEDSISILLHNNEVPTAIALPPGRDTGAAVNEKHIKEALPEFALQPTVKEGLVQERRFNCFYVFTQQNEMF